MTSRRQERVSELLHEQLSILISGELIDPRLADAMLNVTDVVVSPDLRNARVFVEHSLPADQSRHVLAALRHAEGFLRHSLAETVSLRYVPELTFCIDSSGLRAERVDRLLDSVSNQPGDHDADTAG
jgi:ribosome-binding factor A